MRHVVALVPDRRRRQAGEREEMRVFVRVELQRPRDRIEHLRRRVDLARLLEPRVPGDAYSGELRDLLAAKTWSATPARGRQADLLRPEPFAPIAEKGA